MPMTPDQRAEVSRAIEQLLVEEIHRQFSEVYSAAVASIEIHPEQVNNELRNAITHMGRAAASDDYAAALKELSAARSHVERAKRDVIKIAVIHLRRSGVSRLETAGEFPVSSIAPSILGRRPGRC